VLVNSCTSNIKQFYPDSYFTEDKIYQNKPLRFILTFNGNWTLFTDPNKMDPGSRQFASLLNKSGAELLFVGATTEGLYGTRGIAVNLNEPVNDYAEYIRNVNKSDISNDRGIVEFIAGRNTMMKWIYDKNGFRFAEFFVNIDTYDIRIAFWTKIDLFDNFLPVFEEIMSTLSVTGGI
jgi:hypothetical protein